MEEDAISETEAAPTETDDVLPVEDEDVEYQVYYNLDEIKEAQVKQNADLFKDIIHETKHISKAKNKFNIKEWAPKEKIRINDKMIQQKRRLTKTSTNEQIEEEKAACPTKSQEPCKLNHNKKEDLKKQKYEESKIAKEIENLLFDEKKENAENNIRRTKTEDL